PGAVDANGGPLSLRMTSGSPCSRNAAWKLLCAFSSVGARYPSHRGLQTIANVWELCGRRDRRTCPPETSPAKLSVLLSRNGHAYGTTIPARGDAARDARGRQRRPGTGRVPKDRHVREDVLPLP